MIRLRWIQMVLGCLGDYELDKSYLESHEFARSIFPQSWIIVIFAFKRLLSMMVLLCTSEINLIHNKLFFFKFLKFTAKLLVNTRCQITQISHVDMERFLVFLAKFNSCKMQSEMSSKGAWRVSWNEIYVKIIPFDVFRKVEVRKYKT